jgi:hypothetical protein
MSHPLLAQKPNQAPVYQSVQNLSNTESWLQKFTAIKPYVKIGRMSNRQKAEFINDNFCIQNFWGGHGKILSKTWFIQEGQACPEILSQQPVEFPTVVTHKSLTAWRHFMDHQKAGRVGYRNSIQSFQSFAQSKAQKLNSDQLRFCPEMKFSSGISHQNSLTPKPLSEQSRMSNG